MYIYIYIYIYIYMCEYTYNIYIYIYTNMCIVYIYTYTLECTYTYSYRYISGYLSPRPWQPSAVFILFLHTVSCCQACATCSRHVFTPMPSSIVKCLWELFVWGFGVLFFRVCASVLGVLVSVGVCVWPVDLLIPMSCYQACATYVLIRYSRIPGTQPQEYE